MKRALGGLVVVAVLFAGATASAQDALERAKVSFNAGARAYDAGDFATAIEAFEAAEKLAPRPAILFSLAQAHRRQYFLDGKPEHLRVAVESYRAYVDSTPPGEGRRADAAQALGELVPLADRLAPSDREKTPTVEHTKINVSSPAEGARVSCDGSKASEPGVPLTMEVKPGKHTCTVSAKGFVDVTREVVAVDGEFVPIEVVLAERPAALVVTGGTGAEISVDGRVLGTVANTPIAISPGNHLVAIGRNGHGAFVREMTFVHGETKRLDLDLKTTAQRKVAVGALALGGAALVAGAAFTVVAVVEEGRAKNVLEKQTTQNITIGDAATYDSARSARTTWTDAAVVGFGAGAALAVTGFLLYVFDAPNVSTPTASPEAAPKSVSPSRHGEPTEVGFAPLVAPGLAGASFSARY